LLDLAETLRDAYRETKKSNFHIGFHGFYIHLAISVVVATLASFGFWPKDALPANPLGIIFFIGLFHDIFDLDDWIKNNKSSYLLHLWRLGAWLFGTVFTVASVLALAFGANIWIMSMFVSQLIGLGFVLILAVLYYTARLFRLTD
jgi:hypothetical protein